MLLPNFISLVAWLGIAATITGRAHGAGTSFRLRRQDSGGSSFGTAGGADSGGAADGSDNGSGGDGGADDGGFGTAGGTDSGGNSFGTDGGTDSGGGPTGTPASTPTPTRSTQSTATPAPTCPRFPPATGDRPACDLALLAAPLKAAAAATFPSLAAFILATGSKSELLDFLNSAAAAGTGAAQVTATAAARSQCAIAAADRCDRNPTCVELPSTCEAL